MNRRSMLKTWAAVPLATAAAFRTTAARQPKLWVSGLPNVVLRTQDDRPVRFHDDLVEGKMVLFNFFYADCRGKCPMITSNLLRVQELLGDRMGRDIFIYSISLAPEQDLPEVLKRYAQAHGIKPGWLLLTGRPRDTEALRVILGFAYRNPRWDADRSNHAAVVRFGNADLDRWTFCPALSSPSVIADYFLQLDWPGTWPARRRHATRA